MSFMGIIYFFTIQVRRFVCISPPKPLNGFISKFQILLFLVHRFGTSKHFDPECSVNGASYLLSQDSVLFLPPL